MKIRRGTKKILAGFMAMSMVLSCGVVDLLRVSADEGDQTTSRYTVTLKDTDTGTLAFAGAEEKELDFASGESVTVVPSPLTAMKTRVSMQKMRIPEKRSISRPAKKTTGMYLTCRKRISI
ncbi:MAG: hypothetical protein ACLTMW_13940 [Blautia hydrogenotrophica]